MGSPGKVASEVGDTNVCVVDQVKRHFLKWGDKIVLILSALHVYRPLHVRMWICLMMSLDHLAAFACVRVLC